MIRILVTVFCFCCIKSPNQAKFLKIGKLLKAGKLLKLAKLVSPLLPVLVHAENPVLSITAFKRVSVPFNHHYFNILDDLIGSSPKAGAPSGEI